jgi:DNA-binding transcriptional regulator YiaG
VPYLRKVGKPYGLRMAHGRPSVGCMATDALEIARARDLVRTGRAQAIRVSAGLSQGDIARTLKVWTSTVRRWESGERVPRGEIAKRYAKLLRDLAEVGL